MGKTISIIISVLTTVLVIGGGVYFYTTSTNNAKVAELESQISYLENKVSLLERQDSESNKKDQSREVDIITLDQVKNATYSINSQVPYEMAEGEAKKIDLSNFTLTDGAYDCSKGAYTCEIYLSNQSNDLYYQSGNLDSDEEEEVAVILYHYGSGSGVFKYLAVLDNNGAEPNFLDSVYVDEGNITGISIDNKQITVSATVHSENDPNCCPSVSKEFNYKLSGGELKEI